MSDTYNPDEILADPNAHPKHVMYAHINKGIRDNGEQWAKCANCGQPYQLVGPLADAAFENTGYQPGDMVCSPLCEKEYNNYLMSGDF